LNPLIDVTTAFTQDLNHVVVLKREEGIVGRPMAILGLFTNVGYQMAGKK
jgi:hypothetical protein